MYKSKIGYILVFMVFIGILYLLSSPHYFDKVVIGYFDYEDGKLYSARPSQNISQIIIMSLEGKKVDIVGSDTVAVYDTYGDSILNIYVSLDDIKIGGIFFLDSSLVGKDTTVEICQSYY